MSAKKKNLIFASVLLLVAAAAFLLLRRNSTPGPTAVLYYGQSSSVEIPLNIDKRYDVDTGEYTVHIEVADSRARFVDSPCPDHLCEHYGWLSKGGDFAVCMPAAALLEIPAEEKADG